MCTVLLPPGVDPIAVNKHIIILKKKPLILPEIRLKFVSYPNLAQ